MMTTLIQDALDNFHDGMVIHDEKGIIAYCNTKAQELLGLSREQIEGKTSLDPQWRTVNEFHQPFDGSKHPSSITLSRHIPVKGVIMGVYRPQQDLVWLQIDSSPVFNAKGDFTGAVVTFREAGEIKEREVHLKQLSQYLETIIETAPVVIWSCDSEGIFTLSRGSGLKTLGLTPGEVVGCSVFDMYAAFPEIIANIEAALEGRSCHYTVEVGKTTFDSYILPLFSDDGKTVGAAGVSYDVTAQVRTKQKLKAQEDILLHQSRHAAMGEMISMIAHQWRQPVTVIAMAANTILLQLMKGDAPTELLSRNAREIVDMTQFLSKTIDDFRHFFKPGREKEPGSPCAVIQEALDIIGKSLEQADIRFTFECRSDRIASFYTRELLQVLLIVLNNAKEALAHRPAGRSIAIFAHTDNGNVLITVEDNGPGIQPESLEKIFDPYFTTKHTSSGTGVGLYICKTIIEKHFGGTIKAENTGTGARFTIVFPAKES